MVDFPSINLSNVGASALKRFDQDNDGVPHGEYTYYLFGYDNKNNMYISKRPVFQSIPYKL